MEDYEYEYLREQMIIQADLDLEISEINRNFKAYGTSKLPRIIHPYYRAIRKDLRNGYTFRSPIRARMHVPGYKSRSSYKGSQNGGNKSGIKKEVLPF